ncbi:hypothetical protein BN7_4217 [Wickerhamomyces ciferrii]|uniref:Uncharacterized protein n=1 Tax=Wickerhamomyces ciferrii (strain ATCC 14091 / BCRC 22168 / CBS 111 / JCM 3599 / NBRC 0793 / NRRL Y-1031 F-60-10) TaxID=1206466 RepID=K0KTR3_WICCF|nr:uncharacterized protein BN7_4217 [Wickerhamomyces ciferrii]CCH44648.1 hypothetical protein BN7_4217 [Wickerhamomyces ciferrii]
MSSSRSTSTNGLNLNNIPTFQLDSGTHTPSTNSKLHSNYSTRLNSPTRHQLLQEQMLSDKPAYKQIKINLNKIPSKSPNVLKSVSFDTISKDYLNISDDDYDDDDDNSFDDIDYDDYEKQDDDDYFSRNNKRSTSINERISRHDPNLSNYLSPGATTTSGGGGGSSRGNSRTRGRSPSPFRDSSPSSFTGFKSLNSIEGGGNKINYNSNGWRTDYPSRPSIDLDSFTLTYQSSKFNEFIKKNENYRSIIVYITGRRHSWVALDFAIDKCLKNGDHLVVVSRIPYSNDFRNYKTKDQINFRKTAENLKKYLNFLINDDKIIKITIDLFQFNSTYTILNEIIKIYEPSTLVTSTKPNLKFKRNQTWKTARITDRLIKNFSLPIVVVPAFTMNDYEIEFFNRKINEQCIDENLNQLQNKLENVNMNDDSINSIVSNDDDGDDDSDNISIDSNDSEISENSGDSDLESNSSSFKDLTRTISNYQDVLENFINENESKEIKQDFFLKKLNKITDINHKISLKFMETSNNGGEGAALVRSLTGLPELEKTKSMLDVLSDEQIKIDNLKKSLNNNLSHSTSPSGTPGNLTPNGGNSTPGTSTPSKTIKFSNDISNPKDLKLKSLEHLNSLRKYNTHTDQNPHQQQQRNLLSPSRSQPQILTKSLSESKVSTLNNNNNNIKDDKDDKKKKSGFLSKMFGRSKDKKSKSRRPST